MSIPNIKDLVDQKWAELDLNYPRYLLNNSRAHISTMKSNTMSYLTTNHLYDRGAAKSGKHYQYRDYAGGNFNVPIEGSERKRWYSHVIKDMELLKFFMFTENAEDEFRVFFELDPGTIHWSGEEQLLIGKCGLLAVGDFFRPPYSLLILGKNYNSSNLHLIFPELPVELGEMKWIYSSFIYYLNKSGPVLPNGMRWIDIVDQKVYQTKTGPHLRIPFSVKKAPCPLCIGQGLVAEECYKQHPEYLVKVESNLHLGLPNEDIAHIPLCDKGQVIDLAYYDLKWVLKEDGNFNYARMTALKQDKVEFMCQSSIRPFDCTKRPDFHVKPDAPAPMDWDNRRKTNQLFKEGDKPAVNQKLLKTRSDFKSHVWVEMNRNDPDVINTLDVCRGLEDMWSRVEVSSMYYSSSASVDKPVRILFADRFAPGGKCCKNKKAKPGELYGQHSSECIYWVITPAGIIQKCKSKNGGPTRLKGNCSDFGTDPPYRISSEKVRRMFSQCVYLDGLKHARKFAIPTFKNAPAIISSVKLSSVQTLSIPTKDQVLAAAEAANNSTAIDFKEVSQIDVNPEFMRLIRQTRKVERIEAEPSEVIGSKTLQKVIKNEEIAQSENALNGSIDSKNNSVVKTFKAVKIDKKALMDRFMRNINISMISALSEPKKTRISAQSGHDMTESTTKKKPKKIVVVPKEISPAHHLNYMLQSMNNQAQSLLQ